MNDLVNSRWDVLKLMLCKMIKDPVKIIINLWGPLDSRHF